MRTWAGLAVLVGCYSPSSEPPCSVRCVEQACPAGLSCDVQSGLCRGLGDECVGGGGIRILTSGAGAGEVIASENGVDRPACADCLIEVAAGTRLSVRAVAGPRSWFRGWTSTCEGRRSCEVIATDERLTITADFTPEPNRIFVSSTIEDGELLLADTGGSMCQTLAIRAGLEGVFQVLVSSTAASWVQRVGTARGWIRVDGLPVVDQIADLGGHQVWATLALTEQGGSLPPDAKVWAIHQQGSTCGNWTLAGSTAQGTTVLAELGSNYGSGGTATLCNTNAHVVCAQTDRVQAVDPVEDRGRLAFTSKTPFVPNRGRPGADLICQGEAQSAGLDGEYRAFLADLGVSALGRFDSSGAPWIRPDGTPFLPTAEAWASATALDAAPNQSADGEALAFESIFVPTSPTAEGAASDTCGGWTSSMESSGFAFAWNTRLRDNPVGTCGSPRRVICLQR